MKVSGDLAKRDDANTCYEPIAGTVAELNALRSLALAVEAAEACLTGGVVGSLATAIDDAMAAWRAARPDPPERPERTPELGSAARTAYVGICYQLRSLSPADRCRIVHAVMSVYEVSPP